MNDLVTVRMTDKPLDSRRVQKAIHRLPERRPFMTTHQMAEFYGRQPKHINQQARRNPRRFPARLCFELTPEEVRNLAMQIASPNDQTGTKRDPSFYVRTGQTRREDMRFCNAEQLSLVIEALKDWAGRAGVDLSDSRDPLLPKRALVREQWKRLSDADWAKVDGDWGLQGFAHKTACVPNARTVEQMEGEHLDRLAAKLGRIVREHKLGRRRQEPA